MRVPARKLLANWHLFESDCSLGQISINADRQSHWRTLRVRYRKRATLDAAHVTSLDR